MNTTEVIEHERVAENLDEQRVALAHQLVLEVLDNHIELGRGKRAVVKVIKDDITRQDYCVKEIFDSSGSEKVNDIEDELKFQDEAVQLGVRSPKPILSLTTATGKEFMVMETIKGHSPKDIMEHNIQLPSVYNRDQFWERLQNMLKTLHDKDIHHRDIHAGNIMMDFESGEPVILDYGCAVHAFGDEDPYREDDVERGKVTHYTHDEDSLRECRLKFSKYPEALTSRG